MHCYAGRQGRSIDLGHGAVPAHVSYVGGDKALPFPRQREGGGVNNRVCIRLEPLSGLGAVRLCGQRVEIGAGLVQGGPKLLSQLQVRLIEAGRGHLFQISLHELIQLGVDDRVGARLDKFDVHCGIGHQCGALCDVVHSVE